MGFINSVLGRPHHSSRIGEGKHKGGTPSSACLNNQILSNLRPVVTICRIFGVFPCTFTRTGDSLILKYNKGKWFTYSLLIFAITTCYMIFQAGSFLHCVKIHPLLQLAAQSLWFASAFPTYLVGIFMLIRGRKLVQLFEDWCTIERELERLFCPTMTKNQIFKFQKIYLVLTLLSTAFCGYHAIFKPSAAVYPFYLFPNYVLSLKHHIAYVVFQILIIGWLWAGLTVLEGTCLLFSTVIAQCIDTLVSGLDVTFQMKPELKDIYTTNIGKNQSGNGPENKEIITKNEHNQTTSTGIKYRADLTKIHKEDYILFVIKKVQTVNNLQSKINTIMGPLLLVDVGQLVIMTCVLLFLPVRYAHKVDGFETAVTFMGNAVCVLARLILFLTSLGSVHQKGQEMNVALAKAMSTGNLSTSSQNPVLAHLSVFSSNPLQFTAWDFFGITRGTLLAAFSLISTYAIVFFQINF